MSDFTIIIPHRGQALGLWATVQSCEHDLEGLPFTYNYIIFSNGEALGLDAANIINDLKKAGKLLEHIHSDEPVSPPYARQRAAAVADGELLFFFDNHCLVGRRYFERAAADFKALPIDMLHSTTRFYAGDGGHYHYRLKLDYNFWAESGKIPQVEHKPYRLAAGGHGGFVVRKTVWDEVGGYGPEGLLQGYAGEEMMFDLKLWRYGKENWIDPKLIHYHYAGDRGYSRHYTTDYYANLMVSAHVIGGERWLYKVFDSFLTKSHLWLGKNVDKYAALETAYHRSVEYARAVDEKSIRTLDETLAYFRDHQIAT